MADSHVKDETPPGAPSTNSTQGCTIEMVPRHLRMHTVSEAELDSIAAGGSSLNLTFFGVCFGAAISFGIVLYNGGISEAHKSMYVMLLFASVVLSAYFGIRGSLDIYNSKAKLKELKRSTPVK